MKKNYHILVHKADDNSAKIIDVRNIILATKKKEIDEYSVDSNYDNKVNIIIDTLDDEDCFIVNETVDKIYSLINKTDVETAFVRLHFNEDNELMVINTSYIDACHIDEDGDNKVNISNNELDITQIFINENPEKVYDIIQTTIVDLNKTA